MNEHNSNTGEPCGSGKNLNAFSGWNDLTPICHHGHDHMFAVAHAKISRYPNGTGITTVHLKALPGVDRLAKGYNGLNATRIVADAESTWFLSGEKQYWTPPKDASILLKEGKEYSFPYAADREGLAQIAFCPDWEKTKAAIEEVRESADINPVKDKGWPCGR